MNQIQTSCVVVVGGGPAGMMLGFLLARTGVEVVVMEKHADFFRDFRGDTIHPSTLELMQTSNAQRPTSNGERKRTKHRAN